MEEMVRLEFVKDEVFYLPKWGAWTAWLGFWLRFWDRPAVVMTIEKRR